MTCVCLTPTLNYESEMQRVAKNGAWLGFNVFIGFAGGAFCLSSMRFVHVVPLGVMLGGGCLGLMK